MSALQALVAALAGGAGGAAQGFQMQAQRKTAEEEREEERRRFDAQQAQQARQFGETVRMNDATIADRDFNRGRTERLDAEESLDRGRTRTEGARSQYAVGEILPDTLAADSDKYGLRTQAAMDSSTPGVPETIMGIPTTAATFGRGRAKTPAELKIEADLQQRLGALANMENLPPAMKRVLEAQAQGFQTSSIGDGMAMTPEEQAAERKMIEDGQIRVNDAQAAATARHRPQSEPMVTVIGPDGKTPVLVPRSQSAGMTPAKVATPSAGGGDDNVKTLTLLEEARSVLKDIDPTHPGFSSAVGAGWQSVPFVGGPPAGTAGAGYKARLDRFKALNVLPRLSVMKGLGQMSNIEFGTVEKGSTDLDPALPEADFKRLYDSTVVAIEKAYNRARGGTNIMNDPDGDGVANDAQGGRASGAGPGAGAPAPTGGALRRVVDPDGTVRYVRGGQ